MAMYDKKVVQNAYEAFGMEVPDTLPGEAAEFITDDEAAGGLGLDTDSSASADGNETEAQQSGLRFEVTNDEEGELFAEGENELSAVREDDAEEASSLEKSARNQSHEEREAHKAARLAGRDDLHATINSSVAQMEARLRAEHERQLDAMVASMGHTDVETGAAITTRAELETSRRKAEGRQLADKMSRGEFTPEDLNSLVASQVNNHPDMQAARAAAEAQRTVQLEQFRERIETEARGLGAYDASLTGMDAVRQLERFPQMTELVNQGATLTQAYTAVYADVVEQRRIDAAVAADRAKRAGKGHLNTSRATGRGGAVDIPQSQIDAYRKFSAFENLTNEEIRKMITKVKTPD